MEVSAGVYTWAVIKADELQIRVKICKSLTVYISQRVKTTDRLEQTLTLLAVQNTKA